MALPNKFKPDEGGGGRYTLSSLKSGEKVKVRVLSEFITGRSVWSDLENGKRSPYRAKDGENIPVGKIGFNQLTQQPERIKQFIAAVVWNYATEQVEIMETDKGTIIEAIYDLEMSEDWGDMRNYDITVSKSGTGMDTKYSVLPSGMTKFSGKAEGWEKVNLNALYDGTDPFSTSEKTSGNTTTQVVDPDEIPF